MGLATRNRLIQGRCIFGTVIFLVFFLQPNWAQSSASTDGSTQATSDTAALSMLEKKFFMQTFSDETVSHRLARLEGRVFGKTMSGTDGQRLSHLQDVVGSRPDAIFGTPEPLPVSTPTTNPDTTKASSASGHASQSATNSTDKENERLRVQQAAQQQINTLLGEGVNAWRQHNADLALDRFKQVVRLDPLNSQAYYSLGIIYETQDDYRKAVENYQAASKLRPDRKDYLDAITQAQKKITVQQQVDDKRVQLSHLSSEALAAYNRGEYLSALDTYKQIDEKFPDQAINKYNIGSVYLIMRQPEMALPYYKRAKELDPQDSKISQAYDSLQQALKARKNSTTAQANYSGTSGSYPSTAGPPHSRHREASPRQASDHAFTAKGFIVNYGLEVKSSSHGLKVKSIAPGTRAAAAGVQPGDLIESINGTVVDSTSDADHILSNCNPIRQLQLTIERGNHMLQMAL